VHAVDGSGAGQGKAVLDERQGGLRLVEPYRSCGRIGDRRRQRRVPDLSGYFDRLHGGLSRRRAVSGAGPGHRFHGKEVSDEHLATSFRGLLAALPGDADLAFWLPGQRIGPGEQSSQHPEADWIAGRRFSQGVLGPPLRERKVAGKERAPCGCGDDRCANLGRTRTGLGDAGFGPDADGAAAKGGRDGQGGHDPEGEQFGPGLFGERRVVLRVPALDPVWLAGSRELLPRADAHRLEQAVAARLVRSLLRQPSICRRGP